MYIILAISFLAVPRSVLSESMDVTCDNYLKVWFDGVLQPSQPYVNDLPSSDHYEIPTGTKVVGLECKDIGYAAGILASISDGSITDDSWKCSSVYASGWSTYSFQPDTNWNNAVTFGTNGNPGIPQWSLGGGGIPGISLDANWIWTVGPVLGNADIEKTVYCRKIIKSLSMSVTCDNDLKVWIDGVLEPDKANVNDWTKSDYYAIPEGTKVIGLECQDTDVIPGIMANFSDGSITDDSWTCSSVNAVDWSTSCFQPTSDWNNAVTFGTNGNPDSPDWSLGGAGIPGISLSAYWIWTRGPLSPNPDKNVHCRKISI